MKTPGTTPAIEHEIIPIANIPKAALKEAAITSPKKDARAAHKRSQQRPPDEKKIKVMIVDDDTRVAESSARILGMFGYECYAVYNASDALACAESFTPDVILSDVIMDGTNGVELCMDIKEMLPNSRILLFSGEVSTAHTLMQDAARRGQNFELLAKPLRPEDLVTKIGSLFGGAYAPSSGLAAAHRP